MTIAYVRDTGKVNANGSSVDLSFASLPAVGNKCIGTVATRVTDIWTWTDNQSNSWTTDKEAAVREAQEAGTAIGSAHIATSSGTFTVTMTSDGGDYLTAMATEFSGLATSGFDTGAIGAGTPTVANLSVGPTATLAQADELVIATFSETVNPPSIGIPSGYTSLWIHTSGPFTTQDGAAAYKIVNSTAAITAVWTNDDTYCAGVVATYRGAALKMGRRFYVMP